MQDRQGLLKIVGDADVVSRFERFMDADGLVAGGRVTPHWLADGTSFWFTSGVPARPGTFRVDGTTGAIDTFPPPAPEAASTQQTFLRSTWMMPPRPVAELPSPDGRHFARIDNGNIVLRLAQGERRALTTDAIPDFGWDLEAPLFPLTHAPRGPWLPRDPWSPAGDRLFAIRYDGREVPSMAVVDPLDPAAPAATMKVQPAGGPIGVAHAHILDIASGAALALDLGDTTDQYLVLLGWLPDGSEVLLVRYRRDFKRAELLAADAADGTVRTVLAETSETFLGNQHELLFYGDTHAAILPDGSGVIWRSARSGWDHFYLYGLDGTLKQVLTSGAYPVIDVLGIDQEAGWVYFTARPDQARPYDIHLCRVRLSGGEVERLTPRDGCNDVRMSPSLQAFTVVNSRPDRAYRTDFHACDGRHLALIEQADVAALDALAVPPPEEFTVLAADGETELWGVIHKPAGFDPSRRYPLIDHLYAGPQLSYADHRFGLGDNSRKRLDRALAQLGYIVITLDARGTPGRSKAFQDVAHGNIGRHEIADHAAAIRQLATRHGYIDPDRVGAWGHSWGGHFAIRALAQAPDLFRAAVAAAPPPDSRYAFFSEPYLGLPADAPAAYDQADLAACVHAIRGKLLVAAGTADPLLDGAKVEKLLIEAGIDHEFVMLPGARHSFTGANDAYFIRKLIAHFEAHLKGRTD